MSTLEQEIIDKFQHLDVGAKQRVLEQLESSMQSAFDFDEWWATVEALQTEIRARLGDDVMIGALSLLDELREESS